MRLILLSLIIPFIANAQSHNDHWEALKVQMGKQHAAGKVIRAIVYNYSLKGNLTLDMDGRRAILSESLGKQDFLNVLIENQAYKLDYSVKGKGIQLGDIFEFASRAEQSKRSFTSANNLQYAHIDFLTLRPAEVSFEDILTLISFQKQLVAYPRLDLLSESAVNNLNAAIVEAISKLYAQAEEFLAMSTQPEKRPNMMRNNFVSKGLDINELAVTPVQGIVRILSVNSASLSKALSQLPANSCAKLFL